MENKKVKLKDKFVWTKEPYVPKQDFLSPFVGRENEMELIMASWIAGHNNLPLSPLLVGDAGVGKKIPQR